MARMAAMTTARRPPRTTRVRRAPADPAVLELARYRLARDLTFDGLAAEMATAGYAVRPRTLHWTLTEQHAPQARTLYRIRQFVNTLDLAVGVRRAGGRHG